MAGDPHEIAATWLVVLAAAIFALIQ